MVAFPGVAKTGIANASAVPAIVDNTTQVYVRRWTGSAWVFVGSNFAGGGASLAVSFKGATGTVLHDADAPSLTVDSLGAPVVAFTYYTALNGQPIANTDMFVRRWNGSAWTAVGPAVPDEDTAAGRGGATGVSNTAGGSYNPRWEPVPLGGSRWPGKRISRPARSTSSSASKNGTTWTELGGSARSVRRWRWRRPPAAPRPPCRPGRDRHQGRWRGTNLPPARSVASRGRLAHRGEREDRRHRRRRGPRA